MRWIEYRCGFCWKLDNSTNQKKGSVIIIILFSLHKGYFLSEQRASVYSEYSSLLLLSTGTVLVTGVCLKLFLSGVYNLYLNKLNCIHICIYIYTKTCKWRIRFMVWIFDTQIRGSWRCRKWNMMMTFLFFTVTSIMVHVKKMFSFFWTLATLHIPSSTALIINLSPPSMLSPPCKPETEDNCDISTYSTFVSASGLPRPCGSLIFFCS